MTQQVREQYIEINGCRLHYLEGGDPGAPPLLMVHGLTREAHSFDPVFEQLGERFRCLAVDVRGRGGSTWSAPETYHVPQYRDDMLALLDALGLERVEYLGTSMGGIIAMAIAAREPGRFLKVALNDIGPVIEQAGSARIQGHLDSIPERFASYEDALAYEIGRFPWLADRPREVVEAQYQHMIVREEDGSCRFHYDPAIRGGRAVAPMAAREQQERSWAGFRDLACPLLLIRGADSDLLSPGTVAEMRTAQPEMTVAEVPGVGHAPALSEPAARAALEAFFTSAKEERA